MILDERQGYVAGMPPQAVNLPDPFIRWSQFMKTPTFLTCLLAAFLTSCGVSAQRIEGTPTIMTVEVTRIVQVTTTPIPTATRTPAPTLDETDQLRTALAWDIGTPIVASRECYETAQSQRDLNDCASARFGELEKHMAELFKSLELRYQRISPERLEKFRTLQTEWENLAKKECEFRAGLDGDGWPGTMAPMNYGECLISKYEDRLREYQIQIYQWTH
jgi:uncharacterized protein YecT (DUF1311 family)